MSHHVNFSTHGKELDAAYQAVISEQDDTNWLIYAYDKGTYDLRVQATGDGGLEELSDEFSDGKVQFAYAKVIDPNTELPKFVFIGWCGSGVPELRKAFFNSQLSDVSKFFKSFHVQINARDEADVEPALIMKRVSESSGAKYSVHKEAAKPQPRVAPVGSVYKKEEIPDIAAMQRQSMTKENAPTPVGTNYTPVQTAPKKLEQRWNAAQNQDSGASAVRAERERYEREVVEREKEKARQFTSHQASDNTSLREEAEARRRQEEEEQRQQRAETAKRG
ncbi:Drebrin-like protein B [Choanephora cucurbitarum]|uniref:Drebrin-like protein B n=1 Tax=Choanephora cucurbitarum TaxID=101091 RepID=A0A1C7NCS0_9FUNG|nr:Drebrin-like protein B [Choanephora cucurbitarum]